MRQMGISQITWVHQRIKAYFYFKGGEKKLIVSCNNGLCNRLLAMTSGKVLADKMGRDFIFNWRPTAACGCRYEDLFETSDIKIISQNLNFLGVRHRGEKEKDIFFDHNKRNIFIIASVLVYDLSIDSREKDHLRQISAEMINDLPIKKEILKKIAEYEQSNFVVPSIGLHIRRGDFTEKFQKFETGLDIFFQKVDEFLVEHPNGVIFLATDDGAINPLTQKETTRLNVMDAFKEKYGEKVLYYPKQSLDRGSKETIREALIDLILLTKTDFFVGTRGSTFSRVVGMIRENGQEQI